MIKLNLPEYQFRLRKNDNAKTEIFDSIRKRHYVLTPEEWVRQNFMQYLIQEKNYPASLMAIEKGLKLNGMQKRTDIVQYNKLGNPVLIVECKAPEIKLKQDTFDQAARYNLTLHVDYLIITNGMEHFACKMDYKNNRIVFLKEIPTFDQINNG
ncbi:MAG: type I restriction enzyme HsdR N-terminal domain-containing protein [Bacteroidales bacterium]|nr:type I restriction enzyme HsdR N-terminal domain-containing protein [Bacteroidales bacterium]